MKVLWFTNTPSLAGKHLNIQTVGRGWIESLENEITKTSELELGIVFNSTDSQLTAFIVGKTKYYPIYKASPTGKIEKISNRWKHKIEQTENVPEYLNVIREFKPDVIHIFGTEDDFGLLIPQTEIPCIIHIQGNQIVYNHKWFSGLSRYDVFKYSDKWKLIKGQGLFHEYLYYRKKAEREKKVFSNCSFFMGRTDWDRRIALLLSPEAKYFHCEEMLREQFYLQQWSPAASASYTILTTIRKNIYKGLETILECKKNLKKSFPEFKVQWKVAGITNEDEIVHLIEKKYKDKFAGNGIQLLGPLQMKDLMNEMLAADLFIHPSHIDNSPNSVCEAMILGIPIIATYAGGIPSLIEDKKEGLLIQDGDPYALAGAIMELVNDRNYASSLGFNARKRALARHNKEKIVSDVIGIYRCLSVPEFQQAHKKN